MLYPPGVSSTSVVVPLMILLLPTEKIFVLPALSLNSLIDRNESVPRTVLFVVTTVWPLRAAIRPRLSITALSAISANDGS